MCKYCDYNSSDCVIFQDMVGDWYVNHETGEWDEYSGDFVHEKIYISCCPWCGERLGENK